MRGNAALPSAFEVNIEDNKAKAQSLLQKIAAHYKESDEEKKKREAEELRQQQEREQFVAKLAAAKKAEEDLMRQLSAANQKLKEKDSEIERRKQAESALGKELSNLKSRHDALRVALEEENQRALSNLRLSLEADLASSKKLSHDAAKALDAEIEKFKAIETDLKKRLSEAEQAKPVVFSSRAMEEELAQYKAKVKQLQLQLAVEVRRNARKVDEVQEGELVIDRSITLGKGATAMVYRGTYKGRECAVKVFNEKQSIPVANALEREVRVMASARHANLLEVLAACTDARKELLLVVELMDGGSLSDRLLNKHLPRLAVGDRIRIAVDVAKGLAHLHHVGVIHRDVKPQNVLLQKDGTCAKLADFGLARTVQTITSMTNMAGSGGGDAGTPAYMSPELWEGGERGKESDVYAFGISIWELMQTMQAWQGKGSAEISAKVRRGARPEPMLKEPRRVALVAGQCLLQDKQMRPTMEECVEQLEWCLLQDFTSAENKALMRKEAIDECESMRQEVHEASTEHHYVRAHEAAVMLARLGEARIKHVVVGAMPPSLATDLACEYLGRMRAGQVDQEAIDTLIKKVGKDKATLVAESWRGMDERRMRKPESLLIVSDGNDQELATAADMVEMVVALQE